MIDLSGTQLVIDGSDLPEKLAFKYVKNKLFVKSYFTM